MSGRIPLPDACPVGQHEPAILHRCGGVSARISNRCGRCGRAIERNGFDGGPGDPWMTDDQRATEALERKQEAAREDHEDSYQGQAERCPPRE